MLLRDGPRATEAKAVLSAAFACRVGRKRAADGYERHPSLIETSPGAHAATTMQQYHVDRFERIPVVSNTACLNRFAMTASVYRKASVYPACQNLLLAACRANTAAALTLLAPVRRIRAGVLLQIPDDTAISATITLRGCPRATSDPYGASARRAGVR